MAVLAGYIKANSIESELKYLSAPPEAKSLLLQVVNTIADTLNSNIKSQLITPAEPSDVEFRNAGDNIDAEVKFTFAVSLRELDYDLIMKQMTPQIKRVIRQLKTIKVTSDEFVTHISGIEPLNPQSDNGNLYPGVGLRIQIYS